jgi:hypothetical protein
MSFQALISSAQQYFPDLKIKYKNKSTLMWIMGKLLFFNKDFMTSYTTTIGSTIYYPTESSTKVRPISSATILLHELVHINDAKKFTKPLFGFLYLTPQILALLCIPLFFLSWKIALPLLLLFMAPVPSFFRMHFEKKGYLSSLYVLNALGNKLNFDPELDQQKETFIKQFTGSYYYFMWPFNNLNKEFDECMNKIKAGGRPFEDPVFDILDDLISKI